MNLHISYSQFRTKIVNKLHAVFNGQGYPELKKSDLKNPETRRSYADRLLGNESAVYSAEILMDNLDFMELQIESIHKKITEICLAHPNEARSWLSIPGIGDITAATLIAYVGTGERFGAAAQLRNYVALIPKKDQSGNVDKQLGVSKFGCMPIRRHIMQGAWGIKTFKRDCSLTRYWKELQERGKIGQKASVAIANKMLTIGFALLKNGGTYEMPDQENYFRTKLVSYNLEALIDCPTAKKDNDKSSVK